MFPDATMCRILGLSRSGFYAWIDMPPSAHTLRDAVLVPQVRASHERSDGTYGAPRIWEDLRDAGERVSIKRIARLMHEIGIVGVHRRRSVHTTRREAADVAAVDLVRREFTADGPNKLWVADITYVPTWAGFLYLSTVLDAYSRRIVGWSMATHLRTELVLDALDMALQQRRPGHVIHHSGHGCQYTSLAFGKRCCKQRVKIAQIRRLKMAQFGLS
jgi:putative transposase